MLAFTTEMHTDEPRRQEAFARLIPETGRYSHSERVIREDAAATGFRVETASKLQPGIRVDKGRWLPGQVFVLRPILWPPSVEEAGSGTREEL